MVRRISSDVKADVPADQGTADEVARLKAAGYMDPRSGPFRCDGCEYYDGGQCNHDKVDAPVKPDGCCAYYDPSEEN